MTFTTDKVRRAKRVMELFVKAGPDGTSVGDCPFTHFVRAVLAFKGLDCQVHPCTPDTKPDWLVKNFAGKMPCFRDEERTVTESSEIVSYIDSKYPKPQFYSGPEVEAATAALSGLFPALANYIKKVSHDPALEERLLEETAKLEDLLEKSQGPFLFGGNLSILDLSLAPKLYHMSTTLAKYYPETLTKVCRTHVGLYNETMQGHLAISSTSYPPEVIIWGWDRARGTA